MKPFEKLQRRIKTELNIDAYDFERSYLSKNQKEQWCLTWNAKIKGCVFGIGSWMTVSELLNAKKIMAKKDKWNKIIITGK